MSKKQRSLFVQSMTAIEGCFSYRYDKHSAKHQNSQADQGWRVCSFSAKSNLLDTAHNLCEYIKEHYPDIDKVRQIRPSHCQEWLDSKAKGGCSFNTIETYKSNLMKLSRVINHHFGVHTNFETKVNAEFIPDRTTPREFALTSDEVQRVKDSIGKPCHSSNFFIFSSYTCCRVNQVSVLQKKHITFGDDGQTVSVLLEKDKGGRQNLIEVTDKEFYSFCRMLASDKGDTESLFGNIKPNSANRWLNRNFYDRSYVNKELKKILANNDMPIISAHGLRHSNASLMINNGIDVKAVSEHLRHCNIAITGDIYSHIFEEYKARIAKCLEDDLIS